MELNIKVTTPYKVVFSKDCLKSGAVADIVECKSRRIAVITDDNVKALYLSSLVDNLNERFEVCCFSFPAGESSKSLDGVGKIYNFLAKNGITRTDTVIALGGGIVGDTAGFAAATYLRGVKLIHIPTTLLAMVDSAIGGKTAINLAAGKNLAGCFYQPSKVIIDISFLDTLPDTERQNGIGEIIKYGAIMDKRLFAIMERGELNKRLEEVILRCLKIKKKVVEEDTLDTGIRQILNFGHTLGHAVEKHSDYEIAHGKAVGIGMALISQWAAQRCLARSEIAERIKNTLKIYGMPVDYVANMEQLWQYAKNDKKRKGDSITLAIAEDIGRCILKDVAVKDLNSVEISAKIFPAFLQGAISAPPSKSMAHRAIFCAMLADSPSTIKNIELSEDITASLNAASALGCDIEYADKTIRISPKKNSGGTSIDCGESGTTFRFLLPILAALGKSAVVKGHGRLGDRPYAELTNQLAKHGARYNRHSGLPLEVSGSLAAAEYHIRGDISSQYISGLLLALPLLPGDSKILLDTALQSAAYVNMTICCMAQFGIKVHSIEGGFAIKGGQKYRGTTYRVEGDFSNAAFWLCAGALNGDIEVSGLNEHSLQGDKAIVDILERAGADIAPTKNGFLARKSALRGIEVDVSEIPDLAPMLALTLAHAKGKSVLKNTRRLKLKESDRQQAVIDTINTLGGKAQLADDDIIIQPIPLEGGGASGWQDHRIIMSITAAALAETTVLGAQFVRKSYPNFFFEYNKLGGKYVICLGQ